jgi:hypothetical protein
MSVAPGTVPTAPSLSDEWHARPSRWLIARLECRREALFRDAERESVGEAIRVTDVVAAAIQRVAARKAAK